MGAYLFMYFSFLTVHGLTSMSMESVPRKYRKTNMEEGRRKKRTVWELFKQSATLQEHQQQRQRMVGQKEIAIQKILQYQEIDPFRRSSSILGSPIMPKMAKDKGEGVFERSNPTKTHRELRHNPEN